MTASLPPITEREQTDESLRAEREKSDEALTDSLAALEASADAVVSRARARADAVLAEARTRTDRSAPSERPPDVLKRARAREDDVLQGERDNADEILREERAGHVALLSHEREETDKDLAHERARSDHALATRDEFMGIVSHDLQNLLGAMVTGAALIEKRAEQGDHLDQVVTHARRIQRASGRMHRLVGDLVDVVSIEAGMLAVTPVVGDPAEIVREAIETFEGHVGTHGVSIAQEIITPLPPVAFDAARILQVLANLLANALKFTPAGGRVVVHVERMQKDIRFSVSDTGVGIPKDKLEAVFERFVQLNSHDSRGVGLGLYIARCIVQGHGGRAWAEQTSGGGTTVCFTLPVL
jgi:signal transduction histidine kinase